MAKKIIAIASADWHMHNFPLFDEPKGNRFKESRKAMMVIGSRAFNENVPLLFLGDLIHNPKDVDNEIITETHKTLRVILQGTDIYAIPGNHDQKQKNTLKNISPDYLTGFSDCPKFHYLYNQYYETRDFGVYGIPYYTYEKDWLHQIKIANQWAKKVNNRLKILMLHGNAPYAKTTQGETIEDCILPRHLDRFFKDWDLVLFGHIHKPQKLSEKCYMLGSQIQQNMGDRGCDMGYWEIYSDMSMNFISLNQKFPTFVYDTDNNRKQNDYIIKTGAIGDETLLANGVNENAQGFHDVSNRKTLSKAYMRAKGLKDKQKRIALTKILNEV